MAVQYRIEISSDLSVQERSLFSCRSHAIRWSPALAWKTDEKQLSVSVACV